MASPTVVPERFARAVAGLRSASLREEIARAEVGAPPPPGPYTSPPPAAGRRGDDDEIATGRLILLHDPAGHDAWEGTMRLVTYVTAEVDVDMAADPLLPAVGWTWLTDALDAQDAGYRAIGGQTMSTRFGDLAGPPATADIEIRASWTPTDDHLGAHLLAWSVLLASTAGLPPPGITALDSHARFG